MEKKLKIGIIGCGGIANGKHMPSLKKVAEVEMVAFCDIIEERAVEAAKKFGIMQAPTLVVIKDGKAEKIVNVSNIRKYIETVKA